LSVEASSIDSASGFFSRRFSSSSAFSFRASDAFRPRHLYASLIPLFAAQFLRRQARLTFFQHPDDTPVPVLARGKVGSAGCDGGA
jgi:hypothetical protein